MKYKQRNWLINRLIPDKTQWVTFYPYCYEPATEDQHGNKYAILAHEAVHYARQKDMGRWRWLYRYVTNREFRKHEELIGITAEIVANKYEAPQSIARRYAILLSTAYKPLPWSRSPFDSYDEAYAAIKGDVPVSTEALERFLVLFGWRK